MFQSTISPIRDMKGDSTVNIISTPYFPGSPAPTPTQPQTKLCLRLFEEELSDWTTDSSSNDWTTDSEADSEADTVKLDEEEPENEFRWSATP